jgi:hypothetical protein
LVRSLTHEQGLQAARLEPDWAPWSRSNGYGRACCSLRRDTSPPDLATGDGPGRGLPERTS